MKTRPLSTDVLYVGNLTQGADYKCFDVLLKAWAHVHRRHDHARLLLSGAGDPAPWRRMAQDLASAEHIVFLGFVSDLSSLYRSCRLLVLPSRREGMSNALLEAQSWGLPAVVSDIPGNTAVVVHEHNGLVVPKDNAEALAEAILHLLREDALCRRLGENARERMRKEFSMSSVAERMRRTYQTILHEHVSA